MENAFSDSYDDIIDDDDFKLEVEYSRDGDSVTFDALTDQIEFETVDDYNAIIRVYARDFCTKTSNLVLSGVQIVPERGDLIKMTIDDYTFTFKVLDIPEEGPYRYDDDAHYSIRIHTIEVLKEASAS